MAEIDGNLLQTPSSTCEYNDAKHLVLRKMLEDKVISKEQFDKYNSDYQIIVVKCGWFKYWKNRLTGNKDSDYIMKLVNFED